MMKQKKKTWAALFLAVSIFLTCTGYVSAEEAAVPVNACELRVNTVGDIVITNQEGQTLKIAREGYESSGTMPVYSEDYNLVTAVPFACFSVPFSETFTFSITADTGDICFQVDFGDWKFEICGVGIEEVTFDHAGEVKSTGTGQKIKLTDWQKSDETRYLTIEGRGYGMRSTICAVYYDGNTRLTSGVPGFYYMTTYANYDDGNGYVVEDKGEYIVYPTDPPEEPKNPPDFTDVPRGAWFWAAVGKMRQFYLMNGTSLTRFSPYSKLTEAEALQIFYHLEGKPYVWGTGSPANAAGVCQDKWYGNALSSQGHLFEKFGEGGFSPNRAITREKFVSVLHQYELCPNAIATFERFFDGDQVSDFAIEALSWAVEEDIVIGKGVGRLDPKGTLTRAEAAEIMYKYLYWKHKTTGEERI